MGREKVVSVEVFAVEAPLSGRVLVVDNDATCEPGGPPAVGARGHDDVVAAGQDRQVHRSLVGAHVAAPGTGQWPKLFRQPRFDLTGVSAGPSEVTQVIQSVTDTESFRFSVVLDHLTAV